LTSWARSGEIAETCFGVVVRIVNSRSSVAEALVVDLQGLGVILAGITATVSGNWHYVIL
jgi:hypothetical protein